MLRSAKKCRASLSGGILSLRAFNGLQLGTPLNVVLGHAKRISEGTQAPSETKESAATIHRQVKRMEATIRDILGFVRQTPGEEERLDLKAVVGSVCGLLRPLAQRRGVRLEIGDTLTSAPVRGRVVQLEQALSNLVSNAIDASPEDGEVVLTLSREERIPQTGGRGHSMIVARVQDQGPGVAEADVARLFDAFYTSKAAGQGTGLGLWLAEGIVRDHGGSIELETGAPPAGMPCCFGQLNDSVGAEIHMVIQTHGPAVVGTIATEMTLPTGIDQYFAVFLAP